MAGSGVNIELEGQREFRRALRAMGDDLDDLKAAHLAGARIVMKEALELVPILTGTLKDTIRASGTKTKGVVRAGYKRVPYAGPIHFGAPGWPPDGFGGYGSGTLTPQPFLYDARDNRRDEVLDVYADRLNEILAKRGLNPRKAFF